MSDARASRSRLARVFAGGAAAGFIVGLFAMSAIVWRYGNVVGSAAVGRAFPPEAPAAVERFIDATDGIDDAGDGVVSAPAVVGTSGEPAPVVPPPPSPEPVIGANPAAELEDRRLLVPVQGVPADKLVRSFSDRRGANRMHEAIDILAPMGTPVVAVEDGTVARLFTSKAGGLTIYQFDPTERFTYYYAHLDRYAAGLTEGDAVRRGQVIGYVGVSGNAPKNTPHLHFAVFRMTDAKRWWEGSPLDPYDIFR